MNSRFCLGVIAVFVLAALACAAPPPVYPTIGSLSTELDTITPDLPNMNTEATTSPVGKPLQISSPFGPRWKASQSRDDFHRGIDYFDNVGAPIYNVQDGTVFQVHTEAAKTMPGGGNVVVIEHPITQSIPPSGPTSFHNRSLASGKYYSYYLHLDTIASGLKKDDTVTKGQQIGTMGQTGETSFTHLHFETRLQGYCSYQYQYENNRVPSPTSSCNTGFDPHVHPYYFVGGQNAGAKSMEEIEPMDGYKWAARYNATKGNLDIDVIQSNLGRVSFTTRSGMKDITTLATLDNLHEITNYMSLRPGYFISTTSGGVSYEMHFKTEKPQWLAVYDIHGNGIKWTTSTLASSGTCRIDRYFLAVFVALVALSF